MRHDKKIAISLRKTGKSYLQISQVLKVPKSTLSYWLKNIKLDERARKKIAKRVYAKSTEALIKRNKNQTIIADLKAKKIISKSAGEVINLINNKLFIAGISLYWAEGYKKGAHGSKWKCVDFTNSDPEMIKVMMKFFKKICLVKNDKIKIQLIAHQNLNIKKIINFWSKVTKIPINQFNKTSTSISKYSKGVRKSDSLPNGTIHIRVSDVKLFFKIIGWIEGLKKYLTRL